MPKNIPRAISLLYTASQKGNEWAQLLLGKMLLFGKEIPKEERKGLYFLKASAEQGNIYAAAIIENRAELQKAIAVSSVVRIFAYLANLFEEKQRKDKGRNRMILERKQRRKIQDKKMAQGLRE